MKEKFVIIFATCVSRKEALTAVDRLLRRRLVACANIIGGLQSKFRWKGKIDSAEEVLVMLKTKAANCKAVEREIKRVHSYTVPEIIATPIVSGNKEYLDWIDDETK